MIRIAFGERGRGHDLWDGAEVEVVLVAHARQVRQHCGHEIHRVRDQVVQAVHRLCSVICAMR